MNRRSPWAAFGLGPLATIVALEGNYLLAAYACGARGRIGMHFVSGIALFVTASLAFLLWQDARTASHPIASSERAADQTAAFLSNRRRSAQRHVVAADSRARHSSTGDP